MGIRRLPLVLFVAAGLSTGSALDLTPPSRFHPPSFRLLEGVKIPIVVFKDGPRRVEWQPPAGWELRGDATLLNLRPPGSYKAAMELRIIPQKAAQAPDSTARDNLINWVKPFLPSDATDITFIREVPSPFLLGGLPCRELTFKYLSLAQDFTSSIALVDFDDESSIAVTICARTTDFTPIHVEGVQSMFRWNWIGPAPDRIAKRASGTPDSASPGVAAAAPSRGR